MNMTVPTRAFFVAIVLFGGVPFAAAQVESQLRAELFGDADASMAAANAAEASVLAPASYEDAAERYQRAADNLSRGRSLENIRSDLAEAIRLFEQAAERAEVARVSLSDSFQARLDALEAEAPAYVPELWQDAERTFATAVRRLEGSNMNRARSAAADAEEEYREAELVAIENNYFSEARSLIAEAEDDRVSRHAPKTLTRAKELLAEAESRLRSDRYDTDYPRSLAREARYEASHAMYLARQIRAVDDRELSHEDLLLSAEVPVTRIAGELEIVAEFDSGFDAPTEAILASVDQLRADSEMLQQRDERLAYLEGEVSMLEAQLGDVSEQRQIQEQIQRRFEQLAAVFTRQEAQVFRSGDDIIVRMGLNFDSGSSVIKPEYFALLRKIQAAIDLFPDSQVEVQGHTDSFGADDTNRALSENRADAVQQYLLANIDSLGSTVITALGYGETVPLANNETPEGRLRNRRIDLQIQPNLETLAASLAQ
jgi:outer membrane protein OmpA-like peptidoglycan-associated protein